MQALKSPVTIYPVTIKRQRYYARANAFANAYATSLHGSNCFNRVAFCASYEAGLRTFFREHRAPF